MSDQISDVHVQRFVAFRSLDDFLLAVYGTQPLKVKPLAQVLLWYALYAQWAKRKSLRPCFHIQVDSDCTYLEKISPTGWRLDKPQQIGAKRSIKVDPPLLADVPSHCDSRRSFGVPVGSREAPWKSLLEPSLTRESKDGPYVKILEGVKIYEKSVVATAIKAPRELLVAHNVDGRLAGALSATRVPYQLYTSLKMIAAKQSSSVRHDILSNMKEWNDLCVQYTPSTIRPIDKQSLLVKAGDILKVFKDNSHSHAIVLSLLSEAPQGLDITPLEAVMDIESLRRAVALIARKARNSLHPRMFIRAINNACALHTSGGAQLDDAVLDSLVEYFVARGGGVY